MGRRILHRQAQGEHRFVRPVEADHDPRSSNSTSQHHPGAVTSPAAGPQCPNATPVVPLEASKRTWGDRAPWARPARVSPPARPSDPHERGRHLRRLPPGARPGGRLVVVTKNIRRRGRMLDLAGRSAALATGAGIPHLGRVALHAPSDPDVSTDHPAEQFLIEPGSDIEEPLALQSVSFGVGGSDRACRAVGSAIFRAGFAPMVSSSSLRSASGEREEGP